MPTLDFPVNPIREHLYKREELFSGFNASDPMSVTRTLDFKAYMHFLEEGGIYPKSYYFGMMRSLHDYSIGNALQNIVEVPGRRVVAIMGGHRQVRGRNTPYEKVAKLAYFLTKEGFICTSGGGPGAMEATHLGAYFSDYSLQVLDDAIVRLEAVPALPDMIDIVTEGIIREEKVKVLFEWIKPVYQLLEDFKTGGYSFSVPTWHYGHEPATPFASEIAKYYQNSVREDGLLALASHGIIFAEGKAGTIQEIFQDAAQNYYKTIKWFSPMVFLGIKYWTEDIPVAQVLYKLFGEELSRKYLLYTDSVDEAIAFIKAFDPGQLA